MKPTSRRERIVHVMLSERPWGIVRVVSALAKAQAHHSEVWVAANRDLKPQINLHHEVRFIPLPIEFGELWPTTATMIRSLSEYIAAARLLDSIDASVMHFHLPGALTIALLSRAKTPSVYTVHGEFFENRLLRWFQSVLMPLVLRRARATTTISRYALKPTWFLGRVKVIPNGIDRGLVGSQAADRSEPALNGLLALRAKGKGPLIIFPGILIARKGQELAIRSMQILLKTFPEAVLIFVGEGPDRQRLIQLSKALGVDRSTFFLGYVRNQYPLIENSDLVLSHLTSEWPLPSLVELEGLCLEKPVVTLYTDEKFSLYGDSVFFIRNGNESELVNGIISVLKSPNRAPWKRDFLYGRFDWENISRKYEVVYSTVAA